MGGRGGCGGGLGWGWGRGRGAPRKVSGVEDKW